MKIIRSAESSLNNINDDKVAESIACFVQENRLIYGTQPRSPSKPVSWSIALEPLYLSNDIWRALNSARKDIKKFICRSIAEKYPNCKIPKNIYPMCVRPDFIIDNNGNIRLIELNVDRRLDKGISLGVHQYSVNAGILKADKMLDLFLFYRNFINYEKKKLTQSF